MRLIGGNPPGYYPPGVVLDECDHEFKGVSHLLGLEMSGRVLRPSLRHSMRHASMPFSGWISTKLLLAP